jgi:6-phosphogluconolactonase
MTVFTYNNERGTLREIQTVPTVPEDFNDANFCADIHVIPSGKFVYGSNRGHDSIVIYAIDQNTGKLTYVGHEPAQGRNPRNFTIDPTGVFLLAANQDTDNIVTFRIDQQTGKLESTGHIVEVPTPVCLKFYRSFQ